MKDCVKSRKAVCSIQVQGRNSKVLYLHNISVPLMTLSCQYIRPCGKECTIFDDVHRHLMTSHVLRKFRSILCNLYLVEAKYFAKRWCKTLWIVKLNVWAPMVYIYFQFSRKDNHGKASILRYNGKNSISSNTNDNWQQDKHSPFCSHISIHFFQVKITRSWISLGSSHVVRKRHCFPLLPF